MIVTILRSAALRAAISRRATGRGGHGEDASPQPAILPLLLGHDEDIRNTPTALATLGHCKETHALEHIPLHRTPTL